MSPTRQLWTEDNLVVMSGVGRASVGLVYLDPPFASNRSYDAMLSTRRREGRVHTTPAFADRWEFDVVKRREILAELRGSHPVVADLVETLSATLDNRDLAAYLLMMAPRLVEAHRILHERGSLYLHCDPTASHYLKVLLDAIFGPDNFRNEIIWKRTHAHSSSRRYGPVHDVLFFYTRSTAYTWNPTHTAYEDSYLEKHFRQVDEKGAYQLITCTAPGDRQGTRAHYAWSGQYPPPGRHWAWQRERMQELDDAGRLVHSANGVPRLKRYVDDGPGLNAAKLAGVNDLTASHFRRSVLHEMILARA